MPCGSRARAEAPRADGTLPIRNGETWQFPETLSSSLGWPSGATTKFDMDTKRIAAVAALTVAIAAPAFAQAAPQHRLQREGMYRHTQERMYRPAYRLALPSRLPLRGRLLAC